MTAPGEGRVSPLERRGRLLLRMYPAGYRRERGEEMIGTLLETTPDGRTWPQLRDVRALAAGGLQTRAALNAHRTTAANLRIAALMGVAIYLCLNVAEYLHEVGGFPHPWGWGGLLQAFDWPTVLAPALIVATVVLAWVSRRRVLILAGAVPAAAAVSYLGFGREFELSQSLTYPVCLAALAALAALGGGTVRPGLRWLWPIGVIAAAPFVSGGLLYDLLGVALLLLAAVVWLAVDARPLIATAVVLLLLWLSVSLNGLERFFSLWAMLPPLVILIVVAAPALWRLRRQSAH